MGARERAIGIMKERTAESVTEQTAGYRDHAQA
jgi:hypothetical protein